MIQTLLIKCKMAVTDWNCGSHSNIPACCRLSFLFFNYIYPVYEYANWAINRYGANENAKYVTCIICTLRKRAPNETVKCDCADVKKYLRLELEQANNG